MCATRGRRAVRPAQAGGRRAFSMRGDATAGKRGPVSWASLGLVVAAGGGAVVYYLWQKREAQTKVSGKVESYGIPALGGPFSLVDHTGKPVTDEDLKGGYALLYFGFTFCPDICPSELVKMGRVIDMLDKKSDLPKVTPVFITLDPNRDTVAQMDAYIKDFHPRMIGLTGTPGQTAKVAKAFRVYFSDVDREEDDDDYIVDHSIVMYLLGPNGDFLDFFPQAHEAQEIVDKISTLLRAKAGTGAPRGPAKLQ